MSDETKQPARPPEFIVGAEGKEYVCRYRFNRSPSLFPEEFKECECAFVCEITYGRPKEFSTYSLTPKK